MPSDYEISTAAAAIYSDALLQLATDAGKAAEIGEEMVGLRRLWTDQPSFAALMSSAAIDDDARRESIRKIFEGRVSPLVLNLMLVLNDKRRSMILPAVCDAYRKRLDEAQGRQSAHVSTAVPLDDALRERIRGEVQRLSGLTPSLVEHVDPKVMAGFSLQIGDMVYDYSARRKLHDLRRSLMGSMHKHLLGGAGRFVSEG